ncbi:hypothetical protein VOLCADRAFT_88567 [Volvox carteri f. nagariensis]|uniref:procollagen-proline 3-dioxygenase n=1 Tax=Volvox carteri f. nagariensis TaxID=3068 RepID=D8TPC4_VOLCA|nr:uncharacterized protein VOLCADRAFT_88567 [Volvox carteri f. nagariensis]EFJ50596.1 hypothetical protein VOLCADRAFT_88567 [Volvox carteri f. nagariensis]|eukprot:XP_002948189.1 hypothetical protein VOLCADRAFT_88567 [Volvox carteri f. nagariensis]
MTAGSYAAKGHCRKRQRADPETTPGPPTVDETDLEEKSDPGTSVSPEGIAGDTAGSAEAGHPHPRLANLPSVRTVIDGVLSPELCRELIFVFRSSSTVGYRPHVCSATIHDVAATAPWLLPPLVRARHAVLSAVEAAFGLSLELAVEFTGLIGWSSGAALGWHHDANREYLARRHVSAVLYLNNQGQDFDTGDFRFQDGPEPLRIAPRAGRLVAYTADRRNVHCVEEVSRGERCTLNCWFSLEPQAAEDPQVVAVEMEVEVMREQGGKTGREMNPKRRLCARELHVWCSTGREYQVLQQLCRNHPQLLLPRQPRNRPLPPPPGSESPPPPPSPAIATTAAASNDAPPVPLSVRVLGGTSAGPLHDLLPLGSQGADPANPAIPSGPAPFGPGAADAFVSGGALAVLPECWWLRYLGRGLPTTMYQQLRDGGVEGGEKRRKTVAAGGEAAGGGAGGDAGGGGTALSGGGWEGGGEGGGGRRNADFAESTVYGGGGGRGDGYGDLRRERLRHLGLHVLMAPRRGFERGEQLLGEKRTEEKGAEQVEWRLGNDSGRGVAPPLLLWFPSLTAALLAAQFAWFRTGAVRFRSAKQLQTALQGLPEYAEQRMEDLRGGLPTWLDLGSMLSDG